LVECTADPRCKSINFRFEDLLCELNDADRYTHPWDYGSKEGHGYSDYPYKEIYKEFYMTPLWLQTHASFVNVYHITSADQITFNAGLTKDAALLKVSLVEAGVLLDATPLTVKITVANDASIGQIFDSDIIYGVSDGINFIGFEAPDRGNYAKNYPCYGIEATPGETLTKKTSFNKVTPNQVASFYPDQFVFTLKLDKPWGSCFTTHGGGFLKTAEFTKRLMPSFGLTLEVYKINRGERVGIKSIEVTIRKTGDY